MTMIYALRWNIEVSYYEQKTFWALGELPDTAFILPFRLSYAGPYGCALLSSCPSVHSLVSFHENFSLEFRMTI